MAASFALLTVLLAGLGVVIGVSLYRFADRGQEVIDRWQPAVLTSQTLLSDLLNEETSVRGYVLTGRGEFLQPYTDFGRQETRDAAQLEKYLAGHQHVLSQLDAFQQAAEDWRTNTAATLITLVQTMTPGPRARSTARPARRDSI